MWRHVVAMPPPPIGSEHNVERFPHKQPRRMLARTLSSDSTAEALHGLRR